MEKGTRAFLKRSRSHSALIVGALSFCTMFSVHAAQIVRGLQISDDGKTLSYGNSYQDYLPLTLPALPRGTSLDSIVVDREGNAVVLLSPKTRGFLTVSQNARNIVYSGDMEMGEFKSATQFEAIYPRKDRSGFVAQIRKSGSDKGAFLVSLDQASYGHLYPRRLGPHTLLADVVENPKASPQKEAYLQPYRDRLEIPWRKRISYDEFEKLLIASVSKIPELARVWELRRRYPQVRGDILFAGGRLRGLLKKLDTALSRYTIDEVHDFSYGLESLATIPGTDKDLFMDGEWEGHLISQNWFSDWDRLGANFRNDSLDSGGSAIEKLSVSTYRVSDPAGALRDFLEGRLKYVDTPEFNFRAFRQVRTSGVSNNSKIALLLRHLRFSHEMNMPPSQQEVEKLRRIAVAELGYLNGGNYWTQKALNKLYLALGHDMRSLRDELGKLGILNDLHHLGYRITTPRGNSFDFWDRPAQVAHANHNPVQVIRVNGQEVRLGVGQVQHFQPAGGGVGIQIQINCNVAFDPRKIRVQVQAGHPRRQ